MIKVKIKEIAEKNGITTAYQLQKTLNIQPSLAAKWYRNDLKMIGIESLNTLCAAFKCLPSDILIYVADADTAQISNTESSKAQSSKTESDNGNEKLLTTAVVAKRLGVSRKSVNDYIIDGKLPTIQPKGVRTPHFVKESDYPAFELYYRNLTRKSKP
jgi:DNA-binding Xre family transcriptional regulator/predicted DNA-binding transcriptional regulator AlpA